MSFSVDLRARANQNLIYTISLLFVYMYYAVCITKKSILGEQCFIDCGRKYLYSNVSESNEKKNRSCVTTNRPCTHIRLIYTSHNVSVISDN